MGKKSTTAAADPPRVFTDPTVTEVMVGGQWHVVEPGSWTVDTRPPFLHASWRDPISRVRASAFLSHVQMVRHAATKRRR